MRLSLLHNIMKTSFLQFTLFNTILVLISSSSLLESCQASSVNMMPSVGCALKPGTHNHMDVFSCGRKNPTESVPPWFVVIYRRDTEGMLGASCLGTLISPSIVLTIARCVCMDDRRILMSSLTLEVTVGKYIGGKIHKNIKTETYSVRHISIHPLYFGRDTNFAANIALMKLETSVPFMPACVDWGRNLYITPGQIGTGKSLSLSNILIDTQHEYVDFLNCVSGLPVDGRRYVTPDKVCIKPVHGTELFYGLGGGLMFELNGIYYVKGIQCDVLMREGGWINLAKNLSDLTLLHWLDQTKQALDTV